MAEPGDVFNLIFIAGFPTLSLIVGTEFYHSERHGSTGKLHPAAVVVANHTIHVINWLLIHVCLLSIEMLVRNGTDVNQLNNLGLSPLQWACMRGNAVVAERLLRRGARMDEEWVADEYYDEDEVADICRVRTEAIESMGGVEGVRKAHAEWLSTAPGRRTKAAR